MDRLAGPPRGSAAQPHAGAGEVERLTGRGVDHARPDRFAGSLVDQLDLGAGRFVEHPVVAELRALDYLEEQDGWGGDIGYAIVGSPDGASITVALEKDVDFTLLGPLLPGEAPLHISVTSLASPNVVEP